MMMISGVTLNMERRMLSIFQKTIQNQIIAVIGDIIREKVSSAIREDGAIFSIIADEVIENHSNKEILSLYL